MRIQALLVSLTLPLLAGCAGGLGLSGSPAPAAAEAPGAETPRPVARPTEPTTAAVAAGGGPAEGVAAGSGGETIASLGDPTDPGLWLETPLVSREQPGRIVTASGASVEVTLRPIPGDPGAGSRISLAAMQALGVPLTELVTLQVVVSG